MASEDELEYLAPDFDPSTLTVPRLRSILVEHDIQYPSSAKKTQLIEIFNEQLKPKARRLLAARVRTIRTSKGITDMPSSQEGTVDGESEEEEEEPAPPPRRRTTRTPRASTEDRASTPKPKKTPGRKTGTKHPRASDTEATEDTDAPRPVVRKTRRSLAPSVKVEEPEHHPVHPSVEKSPFSDDNPFQSGSSPVAPTEQRRKTSGRRSEPRKSSERRKTQTPARAVKREDDDVHVPTLKTFEVPISRLHNRRSSIKIEEELEDELEAGEEFTPEEQQALIQEGAARGEVDIPTHRSLQRRRAGGVSKSAPFIVILTIFVGFAAWFRKEKIEVGYCGVGKPATTLSDIQLPEWASSVQIPNWASFFQPQCEPCPLHAFCYSDMEARCDTDFVLQQHPLSLGGFIPLVPTCEPDSEKLRKIQTVADRAVQELRERRAKYECGELVDAEGKPEASVEIEEPALKAEVSKKKRRGMTDSEFEELWKGALGEIQARDEVTSESDGLTGPTRLSSSSLARIPIGCAIRRSARLSLARYRVEIASFLGLLSLLAFINKRIQNNRSDRARVPQLVSTSLDRLATQAALFAQGSSLEPFISAGQMRDDVLRDEFSHSRREAIWQRVKAIVELNANVRASVKESRSGEVSRVWEWIGSVPVLEDGGDKRKSGRWLGPTGTNDTPDKYNSPIRAEEIGEQRKWDEGRPIY